MGVLFFIYRRRKNIILIISNPLLVDRHNLIIFSYNIVNAR